MSNQQLEIHFTGSFDTEEERQKLIQEFTSELGKCSVQFCLSQNFLINQQDFSIQFYKSIEELDDEEIQPTSTKIYLKNDCANLEIELLHSLYLRIKEKEKSSINWWLERVVECLSDNNRRTPPEILFVKAVLIYFEVSKEIIIFNPMDKKLLSELFLELASIDLSLNPQHKELSSSEFRKKW